MSGLQIDTDPARLDRAMLHRWLGEESYWAKGIPRDVLDRAIDHSLCFGAYVDDRQIGFARMVTDRATFAWVCDVYVDPDHRGRGLGTSIANWAVDWAERQGVKRIMLATLDAHEVYAKAGFGPVGHPERWMEIDTRPPFA
jgi:GNAT superfamily N-acetyltransferase